MERWHKAYIKVKCQIRPHYRRQEVAASHKITDLTQQVGGTNNDITMVWLHHPIRLGQLWLRSHSKWRIFSMQPQGLMITKVNYIRTMTNAAERNQHSCKELLLLVSRTSIPLALEVTVPYAWFKAGSLIRIIPRKRLRFRRNSRCFNRRTWLVSLLTLINKLTIREMRI